MGVTFLPQYLGSCLHEFMEMMQHWQARILQWISEPDEDEFNALACELYAFQKACCPVIGAYASATAGESAPSDWKQIPALPLEAFKRTRVTVFPPQAAEREFRTSGTTGDRYGSHFFADLALYERAAIRGWELSGLPISGEQWLLLPDESSAPYSSLSAMFGFLGRVGGIKQRRFWNEQGLQVDKLVASAVGKRQPVCVAGTALAWLYLLERCETSGLSIALAEGSVLFETGGYKGTGRSVSKADLYARMSRFTTVPIDRIFNEYGMTELSSQFYARGLGEPHRGGPWVRGVVIDPGTGKEARDGEKGVIRIVDLANAGSCIAVETGDLAIRRGDEFELLGRDPAQLARGCSRMADAALTG